MLRPVTLTSHRLQLRPLTRQDIPALCKVGLDPDLWQTTTFTVSSEEEMAAYVDRALQWQAEGTCLPFAIVERATAEVVGTSRFCRYDAGNRNTEIGYTWFARRLHGSGVNFEAKFLMLAHAFERLELIRVELRAYEPNLRSRRAIEKIGATFEGIRRNSVLSPARGHANHAVFSIIVEEWPDVKEHLLGCIKQSLDPSRQ